MVASISYLGSGKAAATSLAIPFEEDGYIGHRLLKRGHLDRVAE